MSILSNKHIVTALLVAPLLAVLAWFGAGQLTDEAVESPAPAEAGSSYPLIERSGCRYPGGDCGLSNEDFKLALAITPEGELRLASAVPLDYVLVGLASAAGDAPAPAQSLAGERNRWVYRFPASPASDDRLRVVAVAGGTSWFGEAGLTFTEPTDQ